MKMSLRSLAPKLATRLHALLQRVVPPDHKRVVFTSIPDYTDSSYAVYRHLLRTRRDLHITWIVVNESIGDLIARDFASITADLPGGVGHRLSVRSRHSWRGYLAYLRAGVTFHTHGVFGFARTDHRRHIVSLWHGMPIKAIGALNEKGNPEHLPHGTVHLATSEAFRYIIAASFTVDPGDVVVTTLPRTDALLAERPPGPSSDEIRELLNLDPSRKLIFWMPTYRTQANAGFVSKAYRRDVGERPRTFLDDIDDDLLEALDSLAGEHGCQVVIKLHPLDALNHVTRSVDFDNVRVLTSEEFLESGAQLYDVLAHCDGLLSDLSSVLIDFLPTGRPIGLIGLPLEIYERNLLLPLNLFTQSPRFAHLLETTDIAEFMASVSEGRRLPDDSFTRLLHDHHELPGSERVLNEAGL